MRKQIRSGAYQIVNEINGKCYVGSSKDIDHRWAEWRSCIARGLNYRSLLRQAFIKYSIENFTFIVLEECEPAKQALEAVEQKYIDLLKPEYNILPKAYSALGFKMTDEQRQRMRDNYTEERRQRMSQFSKDYMSDPAIKQKYSELRKGKTWEELFGEERAKELKDHNSKHRRENPIAFTEEILARMSEATKKQWEDPDYRQRASEAAKERCADPEYRKRMSEAQKAVWTDPEYRQRMSEALKAAFDNPDYRQRMSEAMKDNWNDPEYRQKVTEAQREIGKQPWRRQQLSELAKQRMMDDPDFQPWLTELARIHNTGRKRSAEVVEKIRQSNLNSEARKAWSETRRGIPRSEETKAKVSASQRSSKKCKAYHEGRIGKTQKRNTSGHPGLIWDKSREKWMVRFKGKLYGRYADKEEAIARAKQVMAELGI